MALAAAMFFAPLASPAGEIHCFGDSITAGYGLPPNPDSVSWPGVLAAGLETPVQVHAKNGRMAPDLADAVYAARAAGGLSVLAVGTNDSRVHGYNGAQAINFGRIVGAEAAILSLGIAPAAAFDGRWNLAGDWSETVVYSAGVTSWEPGAQASVEFDGEVLLLGYIISDYGPGAFSVAVDGVERAVGTTAGRGGTRIETVHGRRYAPGLLAVPDLGPGPHTATITVIEGPVFVEWIAERPRPGARVLISTIPDMTPIAHARFGGSPEAIALFNERLAGVVDLLQSVGADVQLFDPALEHAHLLPDGVHPNQAGHWRIGSAALRAMSAP